MVGVAVGLLGAAVATNVLRSALFGVNRFEPTVLLSVVLATMLVVGAGCLVPAMRAAGANPVRSNQALAALQLTFHPLKQDIGAGMRLQCHPRTESETNETAP